MYRYRDHSGGITHRSISRFSHLVKLGKIKKVKGYRFESTRKYTGYNPIHSMRECVMVYGEKGTARFEGLLWGYGGEGPRGLVALLKKIGFSQSVAEYISFHTKRLETPGVDWTLEILDPGVQVLTLGRK